jgi:hypothetical protein
MIQMALGLPPIGGSTLSDRGPSQSAENPQIINKSHHSRQLSNPNEISLRT